MTPAQILERNARKKTLRSHVLDSSVELVKNGGFAALTVAAVAHKAGISTGTIYTHFNSKDQLDLSTYAQAAETEFGLVRDVASGPGLPSDRLAKVIEVAVTRAMDQGKLAFALNDEPVGPFVNERRAAFRQAYSNILQELIEEGVQSREFAQQDSVVTGSAILGAIRNSISAPIAKLGGEAHTRTQQLISAVQGFCLGAVMYSM